MKDLVTVDGYKLGKLLGYDVTDKGIVAYYRPVVRREGYWVRDYREGVRLLKRLLEERSKDPKVLDVFVGLFERRPVQRFAIPNMPERPFLNVSDEGDVVILMADHRGNPFPLDAVLSDSPAERDRLARFYRFYLAAMYERDKLIRERDLWRQAFVEQQKLLNIRDFEVDSLLRANAKLASVLKNAQSTIIALTARLRQVEDLVLHYASEAKSWKEVASQSQKLFAEMHGLMQKLAETTSRALTETMEYHATELTRATAVQETIHALLQQIKELEAKSAEFAKEFVEKKVKEGEKGGSEAESGESE